MKLASFYSFLADKNYLLPIAILGLTLIMLALTLMPSDFLGQSKLWSYDKLGHFALFGSWTYILGLYYSINTNSSTNLWVIFILGVSFGLLIEILQYSLPLNRHGDLGDLLFDSLGCLLAIGILKKTIPSPKSDAPKEEELN